MIKINYNDPNLRSILQFKSQQKKAFTNDENRADIRK